MQNSNMKILLVDDDPVLTEMHGALLENNDYSVLMAEDGDRAMLMLENYYSNIGVIVSDINMPKMDGYELCKKIKNNEKTKNIPLIFVSALTGLEEKMKGYAVGADDYIPKPVNEAELARKIAVLLDIRHKQDDLSREVAESHKLAMDAMTFSSEQARVIDFYKNVMKASEFESVAEALFKLLSELNLLSVLQIRTPVNMLNLSENGIVSPLESNVIELAREKGRFWDFGARTIVNYPTFSILIKNMPLDDTEKYSRMKEYLEMVGNGLEAKFHYLNSQVVAREQDSLIESLTKSLSNIENQLIEMQSESKAAIDDVNSRFGEDIISLGLTVGQENDIKNAFNKCLDRLSKSRNKRAELEGEIKSVHRRLNDFIGINVT